MKKKSVAIPLTRATAEERAKKEQERAIRREILAFCHKIQQRYPGFLVIASAVNFINEATKEPEE